MAKRTIQEVRHAKIWDDAEEDPDPDPLNPIYCTDCGRPYASTIRLGGHNKTLCGYCYRDLLGRAGRPKQLKKKRTIELSMSRKTC